ncbi:uncharacterized protein BXZ73DRAFT_44799, partial [Epithele typhae]|uniref:uncharacterized protein n=1 Tax=Epithele typhae TaxID=378194 RepID=UPI0020089C46
DAQLDECARALAEAFDYKFLFDALDRRRDLQVPTLLVSLQGCFVDGAGEVYAASVPGEGVVGVAVWSVPSCREPRACSEEAQRGWLELMAKLPAHLQAWWTNYYAEFGQIVESAISTKTHHASWHLVIIGVVEKHRHKGIATALMADIHNKARQQGVASVLECADENIPVYTSLGYTVEGSGKLTSPPPSEGTFSTNILIKRH